MNISIRNCRISVNFYFFALLCTAAFFDRSGIMAWGLLAALLHECGHLAAMLLIPGQTPREIRITPFGMKIENSPLAEFGRGNFLILAAGSGINFISAAVTFGFLPDFAAVSFMLGLLNLLPVKGMDGGGMMYIWLKRFLRETSAAKTVEVTSRLTLCIMAAAGLYVLTVTGYNFTLLGATAALAASGWKDRGKK